MATLILYSDICTTCSQRDKISLVQNYVWSGSHQLLMKSTKYSQSNRAEAQAHIAQLGAYSITDSYPPFVVCTETGKALRLAEATKDKLDGLL